MTSLVLFNKRMIINRMLNYGQIILPDIGINIRRIYVQLMQRQHMNESIDGVLLNMYRTNWIYTYITKKSINALLLHPVAPMINRALEFHHLPKCLHNDQVLIGIQHETTSLCDQEHIWVRTLQCDCVKILSDIWDDSIKNIEANNKYIFTIQPIIEFLEILHIGNCKYFVRTDDSFAGFIRI